MSRSMRTTGLAVVISLSAALWIVNLLWLRRDTRPPVWDMALHQTCALNYLPAAQATETPGALTSWSGNYPPFVHIAIAFCYLLFHPGPHIAVLANIPATVLLLGSLYILASDLAGAKAARWTCILAALTPYMVWLSRETVLDYWLAAWVTASLAVLLKTRGFQSRSQSLFFGLTCAFGMLTKWLFAGFLLAPVLWVCLRFRVWRETRRLLNLADAVILACLLSGWWYVPNLSNLVRYFHENAAIGAREGEPAVFSFQSFLYYLRLLEGYQLFGLLFVLLLLSAFYTWRRSLLHHGSYLAVILIGGWLAMTLLRTKDPRFTMPLLGLLMIFPGAWIQSWRRSVPTGALKIALLGVLCFQVYAANFGVRWLPQEVVLLPGYSGSLRWDWNLYLQNYFQILGPPRREDWKQEEILRTIMEDAEARHVLPSLAMIPDLPRFNSRNFDLMARLRAWPVRIEHLQAEAKGIDSFNGFHYVIMTEKDQGMSWSTRQSEALNRIVADDPDTFRLVGQYLLPGSNSARLYFIQRSPTISAGLRRSTGMISRPASAAAVRYVKRDHPHEDRGVCSAHPSMNGS